MRTPLSVKRREYYCVGWSTALRELAFQPFWCHAIKTGPTGACNSFHAPGPSHLRIQQWRPMRTWRQFSRAVLLHCTSVVGLLDYSGLIRFGRIHGFPCKITFAMCVTITMHHPPYFDKIKTLRHELHTE